MEDGSGGNEGGSVGNVKLSEVVKECASRWFQDTHREARAGNFSMQLLVSQMYFKGYGISKSPKKAEYWMKKASNRLPSAMEVSNKRPGYTLSDSDSTSSSDSLTVYVVD